MNYATYFYCLAILLLSFCKTALNLCGSEFQNATNPKPLSYPASEVIFKGNLRDCGCNEKNFCTRKCCGVNYILEDGMYRDNATCVFDNTTQLKKVTAFHDGAKIDESSFKIRIVPGMVKKCIQKDGYLAFLNVSVDQIGVMQDNGRLWWSELNLFFDLDEYCLEYFSENELSMYLCLDQFVDDLNFSDRLSFIGMMISLPFLLATFIVYALLPNRNLHGKSLMCYVFSLFGAYFIIFFSFVYKGDVTLTSCKIIGQLNLFCFLASFFWMNVMSYDIYSTFSGSRGFSGNRKQEERKRFLVYSAYAWGGPAVIISLILTLSNTVTPNVWYDPGVRGVECFLRDGIPELMFLYGPLAVLIIANIVMFGITAWRIKKVQKDAAVFTKRGSKKHGPGSDDKLRFQLYIRLLFAMGINWSVEIINWAVNWQVKDVPPAIWYLTDFCNAAYGVVIFIIFVCTRNIWRQLKKRYYKVTGKKPPLESTSSSKGTAESSLMQH